MTERELELQDILDEIEERETRLGFLEKEIDSLHFDKKELEKLSDEEYDELVA